MHTKKSNFLPIIVITIWMGVLFFLSTWISDAKMVKITDNKWINTDLIISFTETKKNTCTFKVVGNDALLPGYLYAQVYIVKVSCVEFNYLLQHQIDFSKLP